MKKINPTCTRRPVGGFEFEEDDVKFVGKTVEELVDYITTYRASVRKPIGDPRGEVLDMLEERYPNLVIDDGVEEPVSKDLTDGLQWVSLLMTGKEDFWVTPMTQARADICAACKHNVERPELFTNEQYDQIARLKSRNRLDSFPLGWCKLHRHDNRIAVFLKEVRTRRRQPKVCWCEHTSNSTKKTANSTSESGS